MNWQKQAKLIENSSNVERLPTAARRQVNNHTNAEQRKAGKALKKETASIFNYRHHQQREARRKAEVIHSLNPSPELLILEEILTQEGSDTIARIRDGIAGKEPGCSNNPDVIEQAVVFLSAKIPTVGERGDLLRALAELEAG